eukprot:2679064-Rhodomonas_salina.1
MEAELVFMAAALPFMAAAVPIVEAVEARLSEGFLFSLASSDTLPQASADTRIDARVTWQLSTSESLT